MRKRLFGKKTWPYLLIIVIFLLSFAGTSTLLKSARSFPTCANSKSCQSDLALKIENNVSGVFHGREVNPPIIDPAKETPSAVLGAISASGDKHIYIDLSTQTLFAYQGVTQIFKTFVSTGKWGRTPTGNFNVWQKLLATRMTGGQGADFYDLPNVPYVMYFYRDFGLHGTYWHDNFGHTMSHGCVNLRTVDAKTLFSWVDGPKGKKLGTAISICDEITKDNQCIQKNPIQ